MLYDRRGCDFGRPCKQTPGCIEMAHSTHVVAMLAVGSLAVEYRDVRSAAQSRSVTCNQTVIKV
jgi:hypothetical protein